jgi:alpha-mannosidase
MAGNALGMKLKDIAVLLDVETLDELTLDREPSDVQSLLVAWTVPFHPAILVSAGRPPRWASAQHFADGGQTADTLVLVPSPCEHHLPAGWIDERNSSGGLVVSDLSDREAVVRSILGKLDPVAEHPPLAQLNAELVADMYALGLGQLLVELLTRQNRYMGSLDSESLGRRALRAAESIMRGDDDAAREDLKSAFDLLVEAREYFYSAPSYLVDTTLVAPSMAAALIGDLARDTPTSVLVTGQTLAAMAAQEPAMAALKTALAERRACLLGGEYDEPALPLLTPEAILFQIRRGLTECEKHLGVRPTVFARRRFGLTPLLPQILDGCGFAGACHFTLDRGVFPVAGQSRIRWEGVGGASVEALARTPIDASKPQGVSQLLAQLGGAWDLDSAPTVVFAHWPGRVDPWYDALRRMSRYGSVLGQFRTAEAYFDETAGASQSQSFGPDEYRSPYLAEAVEKGLSDPISRWIRYHARQSIVDAMGALWCMAESIADTALSAAAGLDSLQSAVDELVNKTPGASHAEEEELDKRLRRALDEAAARVARLLSQGGDVTASGQLCINPSGLARCCDAPAGDRPAADSGTTVETPPMGFAWIGGALHQREPHADTAPANQPEGGLQGGRDMAKRCLKWSASWVGPRKRNLPPLAERNVLRNEFFEATIDPATGGIHSIDDYRSRGNRLAQRLALRLPELAADARYSATAETEETAYSRMVAERIEAEVASAAEGRITSHGRLVDHRGQPLATFRQTMIVRRGSRVLGLDIELAPEREPDADPWRSYYGVRFAWDDEAAELRRSAHLMSWPTEAARFEATHFVEICGAKHRTAVLTAGAPYHRRIGLRKLDTLLAVRGETSRRFRLGIGIDLPHVSSAAIDFLAPRPMEIDAAMPRAGSGWLFHVGAGNVIATGWEPLACDGRHSGFRVRLLETEGRRTRLRLRSFRRPAAAWQTDFFDDHRQELPTEGEGVVVDLEAYQWTQVDVQWQRCSGPDG